MRCVLRTYFTLFLLLCGIGAASGQEVRFRAAVADSAGFVAVGEVFAHLDAEGNVIDTVGIPVPMISMAEQDGWYFAIDTTGRVIHMIHRTGVVVAQIEPPLLGRLTAIAADGTTLWAVTEAGEIIHSENGFMWSFFDFNEQYSGFYPVMDFRAVAAGGGSVMVAGITPDGRPAAFTSGLGTVWSERSLDYTEQNELHYLDAVPVGLAFDSIQDSFYLLCNGGVMFRLPACSHCNSVERYPADTLYARVPLGFDVLVLGSDGFLIVEKP
ncbi:MAG: hypothetical protein IKX60_03160 [Bacteroidales bacterium]|nr:hypothetical protein [Bacteroidales bacterium]